MTTHTALVIDDEPDIRELLELTLGRMAIQTVSVANVEDAIARLADSTYDLCLTDMRLPDGSGIDIVKWIQKNAADTPVAVITAYGNMESAIDALKNGAFDFVSKPIELPVLRRLVQTALKLSDPDNPQDRRSRNELLGESVAMREIRSKIAKLARSQAPVYISGESGTGKELVAQLIHNKGPRADKAFVPVNCGAIPADLVESELFGHKKGSFTGATQDKIGLFQAADGGTLFLDEVGELPKAAQVKLLRAIQEKAIRPIGTQQEIPVDVRILSATHKDLSDMVTQNDFRQDLYYRINVIELLIPPLRERGQDIKLLVTHLLDKLARQNGHGHLSLSDNALAALAQYDFPGNVRELENILERAAALCDNDTIRAADLGLPDNKIIMVDQPLVPDDDLMLHDLLDLHEKEAIQKALERTRYNKTKAAEMLGISFRQLRYRLKKLNIK